MHDTFTMEDMFRTTLSEFGLLVTRTLCSSCAFIAPFYRFVRWTRTLAHTNKAPHIHHLDMKRLNTTSNAAADIIGIALLKHAKLLLLIFFIGVFLEPF